MSSDELQQMMMSECNIMQAGSTSDPPPPPHELSPAAAAAAAILSMKSMPVRQYLECSRVLPLLLNALQKLVLERPADPVGFLASFLSDNNVPLRCTNTAPPPPPPPAAAASSDRMLQNRKDVEAEEQQQQLVLPSSDHAAPADLQPNY